MTRTVGRWQAALFGAAIVGAGFLFTQRASGTERTVAVPAPNSDFTTAAKGEQVAVFSGGCFWGIQAVFQHVKGVTSATSGYAGGHVDHPEYEQVSSGTTGHAESVRVTFDPSQVSYAQLLQVFFTVAHDPTQLNRQGPDVGTQYRSIVFYTTPEQKATVDAYIAQLTKTKVYDKPIVTQIVPFTKFWPAEAYHQNYATLHPDQPYIAINDLPKVEHLQTQFPQLYTAKLAAAE
ncbi:MAG TPA: peptide-methionine (S)-S-oxide reductase MsrA [Gemmatimonadaceae bacterium]|nr:peptide-methionine (S)-S-oxide reductase MsrA [Gemmatimonadaceae bacterium]